MAILGIDEVGRGPLAGPLVVGAVILPDGYPSWIDELRDSKKLSRNKRAYLSEFINAEATTGLGWVPAEDIDKIGINEALKLATRLAVKRVQQLHVPFSQIIIDGNQNFLTGTKLETYTSTLVKGDDKVKEISAASIIAKVARDNYMIELARRYPKYGFENHVGYGTPEHRAAIHEYGITPEHRKIFEPCKSIAGFRPPAKSNKNSTKTGHLAEQIVADYLKSLGHQIIAQNHKTPFYEIDLISTKDDSIYFTEVKYRHHPYHGSGFEAITPVKRRQMNFAASCYLKFIEPKYDFHNLDPLLAVGTVTGNLAKPETTETIWFPLIN